MNVPEINEVKDHMIKLEKENLIKSWELPYENLLTRRSAAIFFVEFTEEGLGKSNDVWQQFENYENFSYRANEEMKLSDLPLRVTFCEEEKKKNDQKKVAALEC